MITHKMLDYIKRKEKKNRSKTLNVSPNISKRAILSPEKDG